MANQNFTPKLDDINVQLRNLTLAEEEAKIAQRAGIEVNDRMAQIKQLRTQLLKVKSAYFPNAT